MKLTMLKLLPSAARLETEIGLVRFFSRHALILHLIKYCGSED